MINLVKMEHLVPSVGLIVFAISQTAFAVMSTGLAIALKDGPEKHVIHLVE